MVTNFKGMGDESTERVDRGHSEKAAYVARRRKVLGSPVGARPTRITQWLLATLNVLGYAWREIGVRRILVSEGY
jgi:hypothetical protein